MLDIQITKDYKISSDERNFIVEKLIHSKKGGIDRWKHLAYYPCFEMAADDLIESNIGNSNTKSLKEVINAINEIKNAVNCLYTSKNDIK